MKLDDMTMPEASSEEMDLGLEEMKLPGEEEDAEIQEMISKLEELGYKVEKISDESADEEMEDDFEMPPA